MHQQETGEGFRLSPQQRRLWAVMAGQDSRAYRAQASVEIAGRVDLYALRQACARLVERHEILRTRFVCFSGMTVPLQVVSDGGFVWNDLSLAYGAEPARQEASIETFEASFPKEGFALETGPPLHVALLALSPERHILNLALPGLCADATSLDLLVGELARGYREILTGAVSETAEDGMQYIDLAEWQNELLESATREERALWRDERLWRSARLVLPGELRRAEQASFEPRTFTFPITPRARAASEALQTPAEIFLLGCWQALLGRLASRDEVTVGVAFDGRRYAELETALGLFVRYLPLRARLDPDRPISALLAALEPSWQQAEEAQELFSLEELAGRTEPKSGEPFFPFGFDFKAETEPTTAETESTTAETESTTAETDGPLFTVRRRFVTVDAFTLRLSCRRREDRLYADLYYDARRMSAQTVARLAGQLCALAEQAAAAPSEPLGRLSVLGRAARHELLVERNDTGLRRGRRLFHQRFEEHARDTPTSPALVFENERLDYGELHRRANRLAHHLRRYVSRDELVAIVLQRSTESVVALLAVLKAGAAYAVLDPAQPSPRLALMLEELRDPPLITRTSLIAELAPSPARWICLDRDHQALAAEPDTDPDAEVDGANLAYVLFTSGSSGRPKGVAVEHRQLTNYLEGILDRLTPPPGASFATVSTLAADLGHTAIFPALATGGCLHLVSLERATQPSALAEYAERHRIDYLKIVPSHLSALLDAPRGALILPKRGLVVGGEVFRWELEERLLRLASERLVLNHYGPTEATVGVLTYQLGTSARCGTSVPLGRPIGNTRAYLLSRALEPVGLGMPGELALGGESLSRGYLHRPGPTAERFVPDPWAAEAGGRLYRTGDLVRMLGDGRFEYLDRVDRQIKIRGFRVELGEVEAILNAHPQVRQAAAVIHRDRAGEPRLTAYVATSASEVEGISPGLRRWAQQRLPPYMVPAIFVALDALPLSPNGKIDRKALPEPPEDRRIETERLLSARETPVEEILVNLWSQLLGIDRIDVHTSFLELGGHSILAMQLITRLREICGVEVPLGEFLANPTVAGLGALLEHRLRLGEGAELPAIEVVEQEEDSLPPLSFSQERYWLWRRPKPNTVSRNDLAAFRFAGPLRIDLLRRTIGMILGRHQILRTSYTERGGRAAQVVHPRLEVEIPLVHLADLTTAAREGEVRRYVDLEDARLFDLERAPVFRLTLFRLAAEEHLFLFVVHHIAVDGWSWSVLKKDLILIYKALCEDREPSLAELKVQYKDFATWQKRFLTGKVWDRQLRYWRDRLRGVIPSPNLPTDRPRPKESSYRGAVERFELPKELTRKLEETSRRQNVTLFVTLLASFKTLLYRYTGEPELSVLSLFANRNRPEIENLVGCFMNVLPLRTHLSGVNTFPQLLERVRETTLGAYSHPDIPFDRLVREMVLPQLEEEIHELFAFRILFALGGSPDLIPDLPGLKINIVPMKSDRMYNDFLVRLRPLDDKLICSVKYNTDLFEKKRIVRLCRDYLHVLEAVAENEKQRLEDLLAGEKLP